MADLGTQVGEDAAHTGADPPQREPSPPKRRRGPWMFILLLVAGILVYGLAFQQTEVNLEEITSETRQGRLANILRLLARPDLVTYDTERNEVGTEIAVPCGPAVGGSDRLTVNPQCASPGETVTVTGTGFTPGLDVEVRFVPESEFDISLRMVETEVDGQGDFSVQAEIPDRESEQPQEIIAVTEKPIGSWGNRMEVYTDANDNGQEDDPLLGEAGTRTISLEANPEIPAVALQNPARDVVEFVSTGEAFEAVDGLADQETALPIDESSIDSGVNITDVTAAGGTVETTVEGPPGTDLSNWRVAVYDGATGEPVANNFITDTIRLSPRVSDTAWNTLDKIFETVFLALVATTAGVFLAIPFSFISARNLMRDISVTVTNLAMILLAIPAGLVAGGWVSNWIRGLAQPLAGGVAATSAGALVAAVAAGFLFRAGLPPVEDELPTRAEKVRRGGVRVLAGAATLTCLLFASLLLQEVGEGLSSVLGRLSFVGSFFSSIGEILDVAFGLIAALVTAGVAANLASRLGYGIRSRSPRSLVNVLDPALSAAAGAVWAIIVAQIIDWFYLIDDPTWTVTIPAAAGAVMGLAIALRGMRKGEVAIGLSVYYGSRTIFNTLRSIEPLVMAIVFVVWVGLGPFAGSLALALHTTAALAKLYSEQVESIAAGPIEAVRATGANRLQTVVYAVVPQIVPPYISFTMYRWDINVRMSTILGFVGGGGIGSILQQNINLTQYRAAAVQMLAIAIVVASMDYVSARLRERLI